MFPFGSPVAASQIFPQLPTHILCFAIMHIITDTHQTLRAVWCCWAWSGVQLFVTSKKKKIPTWISCFQGSLKASLVDCAWNRLIKTPTDEWLGIKIHTIDKPLQTADFLVRFIQLHWQSLINFLSLFPAPSCTHWHALLFLFYVYFLILWWQQPLSLLFFKKTLIFHYKHLTKVLPRVF